MLKLALTDGSEYEVISQGTCVFPAQSINTRNRMEIHLRVDTMTLAQLDTLFSDKAKTDSMTLTEIDTSKDPNKVVYATVYSKYNYVTSVGKETVTVSGLADTSKQPVVETHLVVKLEQLTYIEQKLSALGL